MASVFKRIRQFNSDRLPEFVRLKYQAMMESPFRFFRGTCHLFYEDLVRAIDWKDKTHTWICGDLHLENFGSYKGSNNVVYFDLNDFDEALKAPASWELVRFLTSIHVGAGSAGYTAGKAEMLARYAMDVYLDTLQKGKAVIIEKETATGLLQQFLTQVQQRKEPDFIKSKVKNDGILIDQKKTYAISDKRKKVVAAAVEDWFEANLPDKKAKVQDVAFRIAGTGSLGVQRYILLVKAGGKQHLLDLKQVERSSLQPYTPAAQPSWPTQAARVITLQDRIQQVTPKMLHELRFDKTDFVLKALQPTQDRMDLSQCKGRLAELESLIGTMARLTASGQLRSSGRQSSSIADELIAFAGNRKKWSAQVLAYAQAYAGQVQSDFDTYVSDCKRYLDQEKR
ncbi:DUF2252 domain-containing protein [Taibaiella koreensis]|uniref:DUF2252 domain-containing protein n=1 Tax=Taibaiella koreensis TaxID=1268548 RepID=UPI0013C29EF3|nr:DUF2252 family protein [Taibaiella koreensis]